MTIRRVLSAGVLLAGLWGYQTAEADVSIGHGVTVDSTVTVDEAVSVGGDVIVRGETTDAAVAVGGDVIVYGTVRGDAVAVGGKVRLEPGARVMGNVVSVLGGGVSVSDSAAIGCDAVSVGGELIIEGSGFVGGERVTVNPFGSVQRYYDERGGIGGILLRTLIFGPLISVFGFLGVVFTIAFTLVRMLFGLVVSGVIVLLFPGRIAEMAGQLRRRPARAVLIGAVFVMAALLCIVALVITLIGIPLAPVVVIISWVVYLFGGTAVALTAGRLVPGATERTILTNTLIGVLIISIVRIIPLIGQIAGIACILWSFGAVMGYRKNVVAE